MIFQTAIFSAAVILTYFGVEIIRRWTLSRKLLDVPNERSSHSRPTPRGGGLAIVLVSLFFYGLYTIFYSRNFSWSYFTGALLIALISWLDDLYSISSLWRFLIHAVAALVFISAIFPNVSENHIFLLGIDFGKYIYLIFGFLWIVWMTNAYNFMDGIDGLAALQTICAGIGWFVVGKILDSPVVSIFGGILAFSTLGFIFHNWQPAKIFMGDVGSAFLGYTFAIMPFLALDKNTLNLEKWYLSAVVLVWLFLFDTIFTFGRRLFKGEKVWQAHRSHLYQQIVLNGFSHRSVSLLYGGVSLFNIILITVVYLKNEYIYILYTGIFFESIGLIAFSVWSKTANFQVGKSQ